MRPGNEWSSEGSHCTNPTNGGDTTPELQKCGESELQYRDTPTYHMDPLQNFTGIRQEQVWNEDTGNIGGRKTAETPAPHNTRGRCLWRQKRVPQVRTQPWETMWTARIPLKWYPV